MIQPASRRLLRCNNGPRTLGNSPPGTATPEGADPPPSEAGFWALTIGSIGVVYGDIGTSPLYAFREAMLAARPTAAVSREPVFSASCR